MNTCPDPAFYSWFVLGADVGVGLMEMKFQIPSWFCSYKFFFSFDLFD